MVEFISSWGKTADEIRRTAGARYAQGHVYARITILAFQRLCDENGHVVRVELPGQICGFLRASPRCVYAEILHTPNLADATVVGVFESLGALDTAVAGLSTTVFELEHFTLRCPPLDITRGSLDDVLPDRSDVSSAGSA